MTNPVFAVASPPGPPNASPLLNVVDLAVHFPVRRGVLGLKSGLIRAVDGVDFAIPRGETLALVGESGCGKSTTARAILGVPPPTSGSVKLDGIELTNLSPAAMRAARRRMQLIFQDPFSSLDPRMRVREIISEPIEIHGLVSGRQKEARVRDLLTLVGLRADTVGRFPHEFSGGQRQRIGIARALAAEPELIVADEPISALDVSVKAQIINLLEDLQDQFNLTYLFVAHDLAVVRHTADRVAVMYLGKIVELATRDALYAEPAHPYTQALLSAAPIPDPIVEGRRRRILLAGDVPRPADPPPGCRFHTRCFLRDQLGRPEICSTLQPVLEPRSAEHAVACHFASESRQAHQTARTEGM